jgi:FtsZ-interacting cell division protein YlmF
MAPALPLVPSLPSLPARATSLPAQRGAGAAGESPTILVLHPQGMADGQRAIEAVRGGQSVILDASALEPSLGQRLVDYTCGGIQAMDGQSRRLGDAVFLFTTALSRIEEEPGGD